MLSFHRTAVASIARIIVKADPASNLDGHVLASTLVGGVSKANWSVNDNLLQNWFGLGKSNSIMFQTVEFGFLAPNHFYDDGLCINDFWAQQHIGPSNYGLPLWHHPAFCGSTAPSIASPWLQSWKAWKGIPLSISHHRQPLPKPTGSCSCPSQEQIWKGKLHQEKWFGTPWHFPSGSRSRGCLNHTGFELKFRGWININFAIFLCLGPPEKTPPSPEKYEFSLCFGYLFGHFMGSKGKIGNITNLYIFPNIIIILITNMTGKPLK